MLTKSRSAVSTIAKAVAISATIAGAAFAQSSTTVTTETTVPSDAVPLAYQGLSDVQITDFLTARGLTDVSVQRKDGHITASGKREGNAVTFIYNEADGKLLTVDGNAPDQSAYVEFMNLGVSNSN